MHYANINAMNDTDFLCLLQKSLGINHSQKGLYVLTPENVTKTTAMRIVQLIKSGMKHGDISDLFAKHNILITTDNIACVHCRGLKTVEDKEIHFIKGTSPILGDRIENSDFLEMEINLRRSISENKDFFLKFQPQINSLSNSVYGVEALIRWRFNGDIISPNKFIPVAEITRQIVSIGEFAFLESCRKSQEWKRMINDAGKEFKISVNISPIQLTKSLVELIFRAMREFSVSPKNIGFELTESYLIGAESISIVNELHDYGFSISIDDFGTGYSCLSEIKNFPIDVVKIDRSFLRDIEHSASAKYIVQSIIGLASNLGINTVAEGVENIEQFEILHKMGCYQFQGFLFSKPLCEKDFIEYYKLNHKMVLNTI